MHKNYSNIAAALEAEHYRSSTHYIDFCDSLCSAISKRLGDQYVVTKGDQYLNNGIISDNVTIRRNDLCTAPSFRLRDLYISYLETTLEDIVERIVSHVSSFYSDAPFTAIAESDAFPLENYKDYIFFSLVNREKNIQMLEKCPWLPFLDMAVVFRVQVPDVTETGFGVILITNDMYEKAGFTLPMLKELATVNTPKLFEASFLSMRNYLLKLLQMSHQSQAAIELLSDPADCDIYVLTTASLEYGSSAILYKSLLADIHKLLGEDFYIIPSSTKELIIAGKSCISKEAMRYIINTVNQTQLDPLEFLSDSIFEYPGIPSL